MNKACLIIFVSLVLFTACRGTKYMPEDTRLLTKASVTLKSDYPINGEGALKSELNKLLRPEPNSKVLGMRLGLWSYYKTEKGKAGFYAKFIKKKFGEEPVYVKDVKEEQMRDLIINRLENRGFYGSKVEVDYTLKKKTGKVKYTISLPQPYVLAEYIHQGDSGKLRFLINRSLERTRIEKDDRYDLEALKDERDRIDEFLKNRGFYNFNDDYLIFKVDTNQGNNTFKLYLSLKADIPANAQVPYNLRNIYVHSNHVMNDTVNKNDTVEYEDMYFISPQEIFKPHHLERYILLRKGRPYSKRRQDLTTYRISSIGTYQYVNIRFKEVDSVSGTSDTGFLDARLYLSPLKRQSLRLELQALTKSNNFAGPAVLATYRNRNLFRGGELISISGKAGMETQLSGGPYKGLFSYETGIQADLIFPRMISPFKLKTRMRYSVPKTIISASYTWLSRVQYYVMRSALAKFGYRFSSSREVSHEVYPISLNVIGISSTTPEFEQILSDNDFLARSFEQQFIIGPTYSFRYSQLEGRRVKINRFLFLANADVAGNLINLIQTGIEGPGPKTIFGRSYAQYYRFDGDIRHYLQLTKNTRLVSRFFAGIGIPTGNSVSLPYIKQFFSGGPSSLRGFRIRSVGPGTYKPDVIDVSSFFDQSGDIKMEANAEYRFPLVSVLKGAIFFDAGNIWLLNENPDLPGGKFSNNWYKEWAVNTGIGFRVDIEFFVIRLDAGVPIRKPWHDEGDRWINEFRFGYRSWRRENLIWNLAIGYPF